MYMFTTTFSHSVVNYIQIYRRCLFSAYIKVCKNDQNKPLILIFRVIFCYMSIICCHDLFLNLRKKRLI